MTLREAQLMQLQVMKIIHNICVQNNLKYFLICGSCLGAVRHGGFIPWDDDIDIGMLREDYDKFCKHFNEWFDTNKYFLQNIHTDSNIHFALSRVCIKGTVYENKRVEGKDICENAYIDVFPIDNVPDDVKSRKKHAKALLWLKYIVCSRTMNFEKFSSKLFFGFLRIISYTRPLKYWQTLREQTFKKYSNTKTTCVSSLASKYGYWKQTINRESYGNPVLHTFEDTEFYVPEKYTEYLTHLFGSRYMELPPEEKRVKPHPIYIEINEEN